MLVGVGGLAICGGEVSIGGCGGRWKRRCDDDGVEVELPTWAELIERSPRGCALIVPEVPCYPSSPARDWNAWVRNLTSTKAPNPPHNTDALHAVKRPGCASAHGQGKQRITQLAGGRTCEGWRRRRELARSACKHGGNTPRTPTLWPIECEAITRRNLDVRPPWGDRSWGCRGRCARRAQLNASGRILRTAVRHNSWGGLGDQRKVDDGKSTHRGIQRMVESGVRE